MRIGDTGYYSMFSNEAYKTATSGKTKKLWGLKHYDNMNPYGAFSIIGEYIIGQPGTTIERLTVLVWVEW